MNSVRPSWPVIAMVLAAFSIAALTAGSFLMPLLGLGVILARFTDRRFPDAAWVWWTLRGTALLLVTLFGSRGAGHTLDLFISSTAVEWFGHLAAAELAVRAWIRRPVSLQPAAVGLSGLVLLAGATTNEGGYVMLLSPLWVVAAVVAAEGPGLRLLRPRARVLLGTGLAVGLALGGVGAFFVAQYRVDLTAWANDLILGAAGGRVSGLARRPRLGSTFELRGSAERTLRLEGDLDDTHLRALPYDEYLVGSWGPTSDQRLAVQATPASLGADADGPRIRVERLTRNHGLFPLTLHAAGLDPLANRGLLWDPVDGAPVQSETSSGYLLIRSEAASGTGFQPFARRPGRRYLRRLLALPVGFDPRVIELAQRIGAGESDPEALCRRVELYLASNHEYSLTTTAGPGDPIVAFLLEKRSAHCEYFGTAAVLLLRALGVPARYITGYLAHEHPRPGTTIVRERDAHAWAEAWLGDRWITVEATPATGRPDGLDTPLPWYVSAREWLEDAWRDLPTWLASGQGRAILFGTLLAVLVAGAALVLRARLRGTGPASDGYQVPDPAIATLGRRFDRLLTRLRLPCPPTLTWTEWLAPGSALPDLAGLTPEQRISLRVFVAEYNAARFGETGSAALDEHLQQLETDLRQPARGPAG